MHLKVSAFQIYSGTTEKEIKNILVTGGLDLLIFKMELMESFSSVQISKQQLTLKQCPTRALGTQHCYKGL